ncbi:beta-methylarginine biosynthesis bifunctional aminotransferase [Xylanimonas oleitrophica]|uniref:Beta-methylarginine biosynthesis bifunctional aminotransferase n=1 Tax=Xylanimonas oleitrophica TaxID=2607479 RepID=A0A2W5WX49_9MICO|nr:beta-methylarginine biosynthesis bifunctional aminotransferase [Xylanimonas oleitrophica]PZR52365.1 beta-methylarginine biosynthesis bifunctional aminotransferase [Xylanimonas oleitrophica]
MTAAPSRGVSALQRRLSHAEERPGRDWTVLVENVPEWPEGTAPLPSADVVRAAALTYQPSQGLVELRAALVNREQLVNGESGLTVEHFLVTNGAMHAIGLVLRTLAARGFRTVLAEEPVFRGVYDAVTDAGLSLHTVGPDGWDEDWPQDDLTALYVNLPANPTGRVLTPDALRRVERAASQGVPIVFDAVYDAFSFAPDRLPSPVALAVASPDVFVVNSMSKNYGRPGDRVGWIVAHEASVAQIVPRLEWETVSINSVVQYAALDVVEHGNDALVGAVRQGREHYAQLVAGHPVLDVPIPPGGTQLWLPLGVDDVEAFADHALDMGLVLTTSANYFPSPEGYIRFPTGISPRTMRRAVDALDLALRRWGGR